MAAVSAAVAAVCDGDRATVRVSGPVERALLSEVHAQVDAAVAAGARRIVVDLAGVRQGDRRLLAELTRCRARLESVGGALEVHGLRLPQFSAALEEASLGEVFLIYDAVRLARQASRGGVGPAPDPARDPD